jgi:hypothetical protein
MPSRTPLWKQVFDAVDQRVGPVIDELAGSEELATAAALARRGRSEVERRLEQSSRRVLHLLNLPAGSDVNRLLEHIARLEREVGDLRDLLADHENASYLAELSARHRETSGEPGADRPPSTSRSGRAGSSRKAG